MHTSTCKHAFLLAGALTLTLAQVVACSSPDAPGPASDAGRASDAGPSPSMDARTPDASDAPVDASDAPVDASRWSCTPPYVVPAFEPAADDTVAFDSLLEAAGYASPASSDWVGMAAGNLCGDGRPELVLVKNTHSFFSVLGGPTPVAIGSGDLSSTAANPWRAVASGDLDGDGRDEVVAVRSVSSAGATDLVVARANDSCSLAEVASLAIGSPANSAWVAVTTGDFDGDGTREIVALKDAHTSFVMVRLSGSTLAVAYSADLASNAAMPWRALAAGDLDGDGRDELIAAREVTDGSAETILVFRWNGSAFERAAGSTSGNAGNSAWAALAVGDFNGDGHEVVAAAKDRHSNFTLFELAAGASALTPAGSSDLATAPGQSWRGVAAVDWLDGDRGADELVTARAATGAYRADVLVYGSAWHRAARASALASTRAQYAGEPRTDDRTPADLATLESWLVETHANTYSFLLWDTTGQDYLDLVALLVRTQDFCVDDRQLRIWVTLIPPTEHASGRCSIPVDSPLTPFDDTSFFAAGGGEASCEDYVGWADLLAHLAELFPHLVGVTVDDATHNLDTALTPEVIAAMESRMHARAPWMSLVPTFYYQQAGVPSATRWPDVGLTLDSILFYFRNERQGEGPCSACATPGACTGACLASTCAEATVANAPGEIAELAGMLAPDRALQVGVYFTGHSACGEPSVRYDHDLLQTALAQPRVEGAHVYTTHHPSVACTDATALTDKGCAVASVFAASSP